MSENIETSMFTDRASAISAARSVLMFHTEGFDPDAIDQLLREAGVVRSVDVPKAHAQLGSEILVGSYVIRNDELINIENFLDLALTGWKLGVAAGEGKPGVLSAVAFGSAIYDVYKVVKGCWAKALKLDPLELRVVECLLRLGSASIGEIATDLGASCSIQDIEVALHRLEIGRSLPNGVTECGERDRWRLKGV